MRRAGFWLVALLGLSGGGLLGWAVTYAAGLRPESQVIGLALGCLAGSIALGIVAAAVALGRNRP